MTKKVTKAVIAAAGFGTRFLPQTKAMPKEMLPLVDEPVIQYVVQDLVSAAIKDIIIVDGYSKRSIEDHFDSPNQDLLNNLLSGGPGKKHYIDQINKIANLANFAYIRQKGPYGTATPISNALHLIGDEPFIYTFADDLIISKPNPFKQLIDLYYELEGTIMPCVKVSEAKDFDRYGIISGEKFYDGVVRVNKIVEKPGIKKAPSNLASVVGYLFDPEVFKFVKKANQNIPQDKEFFATDYIIEPMIEAGVPVYGYEIKNSKRYDTGNVLDYLKTVFDFALERKDIGPELKTYLKTRIK